MYRRLLPSICPAKPRCGSGTRNASSKTSRLSGANAVVVGGTSGIGHGIAVQLAREGAIVTIVGRDAERGAAVVREMSGFGGTGHSFKPCDASLLANVRAFSAEYSTQNRSLDILVTTQGMATMAGRSETTEGIDKKLALHYYSRTAFAINLLPLLRQSRIPGGAAVLSVLSAGMHAPYKGYLTDPELRTSYSIKNAADAAGFYTDCAWDALSRQKSNSGISWIHADPGMVNTRWGQADMPLPVRLALRLAMPLFGESIYDCGARLVGVLRSIPDKEGAGLGSSSAETANAFMLVDRKGRPAAPTRLHDTARDAVWSHTEVMLRARGAWVDSE